jgi:acyl-CoA synthetase (AMP-forming)/AMP-acid ligase II
MHSLTGGIEDRDGTQGALALADPEGVVTPADSVRGDDPGSRDHDAMNVVGGGAVSICHDCLYVWNPNRQPHVCQGRLILNENLAKVRVMELFERWLETCSANRQAWAIQEASVGRVWTFAALEETLRSLPRLKAGIGVSVSAQDGVVNFVLKTLQVWRDGAVLMPVEKVNFGGSVEEGFAPSGVVHVKTTSGSTGEARRVYFEAGHLVADCLQIQETMRLSKQVPNLAVISVAHSYGFSNLVLPLLLSGTPLIALTDPLPGTMRRAFATSGRVTLPAVPAMWRAWSQAGVLHGADIACAITAGAPMPLELETTIFENDGLKVHNFYGSSECGGIAYDATDLPRTSSELAGAPMSGVSLAVGLDGCLEVRGPTVARGYDIDSDSLTAGVFRTSDLARLDKGQVFLEGRLTDTIHVAGRKVSPQVIEAALLRHPGVRHCVVFGIASSDAARVEEIVACVNTIDDVSPSVLQAGLRKELPGWQVPRHWWQTEALLPDARGKFSRAVWRQRFKSSPGFRSA